MMNLPDPTTPDLVAGCAAEPIHIPGSVQRRGVMLVVEDGTVVQSSENLHELMPCRAEGAIGQPLASVVGPAAQELLAVQASAGGPLADTLHHITVDGSSCLAALHRSSQGSLIVEIEPMRSGREDSISVLPETHNVLRDAAAATSSEQMYALAAAGVRRLTGFDRVMVYVFDSDYNGRVVAEDSVEGLDSFLDLHFPASDIPAQARALYEKSWIRLISDVEEEPARLLPHQHPGTGQPTDLTYATLRAVSPVHVEYLRNMGVSASMSVSLLDEGRLWGLLACHHYSGAHTPSLDVRAAVETLAAGLSQRLALRAAADRAERAGDVQEALRELVEQGSSQPLAQRLAAPRLLSTLDADGIAVEVDGHSAIHGVTPANHTEVVAAVLDLAPEPGFGGLIYACEAFTNAGIELSEADGEIAGALVARLPDNGTLALFRREAVREVSWGGDPSEKRAVTEEDGTRRLGPRRSFAAWREHVTGFCRPWSREDMEGAIVSRRVLVELLFDRLRSETGAAVALQRSSLPAQLPTPEKWTIGACYYPADGARVGGDWYDVFELPSGEIALVVGDVAGHGLAAASTMSQLRNGLRSLLIADPHPQAAVSALDRLVKQLLPEDMATLWLGVFDPASGVVDYVSCGHPPAIIARQGKARRLGLADELPLGFLRRPPRALTLTLQADETLLIYSDGLVERRGEPLDRRIEQLRENVAKSQDLNVLGALMSRGEFDDDVTMLMVRGDENPGGSELQSDSDSELACI